MLIQALCNYYDILSAEGKVLPEGYSKVKIHYLKSVYLIATRDLRISGCNFFYLKIKGLCDFLRKRF